MEQTQSGKMSNAKIATSVGVSESLVSRWKTGERKINPEVAIKLGMLFGVDPAQFVFNGRDGLAEGEAIKRILETEINQT